MSNDKFNPEQNYRSMKAHYEEEAARVDQEWRQQRARILNDRNLSDVGKRTQLEEIDSRRVARVSKLQEEATGFLGNHRKILEREHAAAATAELAARRELLGDAVIVDLWARRLAKMDGRAIQAAYADTVGWEKEIVRAYALAELDGRRNEFGDLLAAGDNIAWNGLQVANPELDVLRQRAHELEHGAEWVESLDIDGHRRNLAPRVGVPYEAFLLRQDELDKQAQAK